MANFSVSEFTSNIAKKGLASPNKFRIHVRPPTSLMTTRDELNLMVENVDLAGRNINSAINIEYGVRREVAYNAPAYDPLNVTFLCSQDMAEKIMLERWNNHVVKINEGFDVEYYDNYVGSVTVQVLNKHDLSVEYEVRYLEAYPKVINSIPLNHSTTNQTMRVTARFVYSYYETPQTARVHGLAGGRGSVIEQPGERAAYFRAQQSTT